MQADVNRVAVKCRPVDAYDYVADLTTHPLWSLDNIRIEELTPAPVQVGSRFRTVGHSLVMQRDNEAEIEITSFERPHCFAFVAHSGPRDFNHVFTFSEEGGGTVVERTMTFEPVPALAERLQAISKLLDERRDTSMSMLKELIESRAGTSR